MCHPITESCQIWVWSLNRCFLLDFLELFRARCSHIKGKVDVVCDHTSWWFLSELTTDPFNMGPPSITILHQMPYFFKSFFVISLRKYWRPNSQSIVHRYIGASRKYRVWHPVNVSNGLTIGWPKLDKQDLGLKLDVSRLFRDTERFNWPLTCTQEIGWKFGD